MTVGLLTLHLVSIAVLAVTVFYGHAIPQGGGALGRHLNYALLGTLLAVFAQIMTLFYFIGISSSIKKSLAEIGGGEDILQKNRVLKSRVMPWAMGASGLLMVTFILGGGAHTCAIPGWAHGSLGYVSFGVTSVAFLIEAYLLFQQNFAINEFNRRGSLGQRCGSPPGTSIH